jgi:hypothetical protein
MVQQRWGTLARTRAARKRRANGLADVPAIEWLFDHGVLPDELIDRSVRKHQQSLSSKRQLILLEIDISCLSPTYQTHKPLMIQSFRVSRER